MFLHMRAAADDFLDIMHRNEARWDSASNAAWPHVAMYGVGWKHAINFLNSQVIVDTKSKSSNGR